MITGIILLSTFLILMIVLTPIFLWKGKWIKNKFKNLINKIKKKRKKDKK